MNTAAFLVLSLVCYISLIVVGRQLRRQRVLVDLLSYESEVAEFWQTRVAGLVQMRLDFGDEEALAWFDLDMAQSQSEIRELLARGDRLLERL